MRTRSVQRHIGESTRLWAGQGLNPKHPEALGASTCLRHRGTRSTGRTAEFPLDESGEQTFFFVAPLLHPNNATPPFWRLRHTEPSESGEVSLRGSYFNCG